MTTHLDLDDVCAGHPKAQEELTRLRAECDALRVPCRTLVSLLETDNWQATLRLAVEQARAALKEAKE